MDKAKVLVVEDKPNIREVVEALLDMAGHTVVGETATLPEALQAVDAIANGNMPCDVVVLDGNLGTTGRKDNADAKEIMAKMREYELGVKVIGFTGGIKLSECGLPVDVDVDKTEVKQLLDRIAEF